MKSIPILVFAFAMFALLAVAACAPVQPPKAVYTFRTDVAVWLQNEKESVFLQFTGVTVDTKGRVFFSFRASDNKRNQQLVSASREEGVGCTTDVPIKLEDCVYWKVLIWPTPRHPIRAFYVTQESALRVESWNGWTAR